MSIELYCEDCLERLKQLPDKSIDLVVTDPPYSTTSRGSAGTTGGMFQKELNKKGRVFSYNDISCEQYAPEFYRVLKEGTHCYIMTNHVNLVKMLNVFIGCGFHFTKSLIWDKGNKICCPYYMSQFEYILFFRKGRGKPINNCGTSDILSIPNKKIQARGGGNLHDTEKPVELYKVLIANSTQENDTVLDPFMGIGGGGVACKMLHRNFIGIEIDPEYFKIAQERINEDRTPLFPVTPEKALQRYQII